MSSERIIPADKPYGVNTHRVSPEKPGLAEWLAHSLHKEILTVHRLDKETTGALLFASDSDSARTLTELFSARAVKKTYLFITDRTVPASPWTVRSRIFKQGKEWISARDENSDSETSFRVLKSFSSWSLVEAQPLTGRTHQIRLHARDSQIPLLGDSLYGGTPFPVLFLHSLKIEIPELDLVHHAPPPLVYEDLSLLQTPRLCRWLMSYDRRRRLYPDLLDGAQCLRLIHDEDTPLRVDLLGDQAHAGWWEDEAPPDENDLAQMKDFFHRIGITKWGLQTFLKDKTATAPIHHSNQDDHWIAHENHARFLMKRDSGLSPGLFLDQRDNRLWLKSQSRGKDVLNLFAYTGGFSVMAALGEANSVTTVDLSKKYVEWSKENFTLNQLAPSQFKFHAMDSLDYLAYAQKKGLNFDLIVCDPPSFSRNGGTVFRIEKDYKKLIQALVSVLKPQGTLLFSTNYEQWSLATWEQQLKTLCNSERLDLTTLSSWQWDFEITPETSVMKAFHIRKK